MRNRQTEMLRKARAKKKYKQQVVANLANILCREYQRLELGKRTIANVSMEHGLSSSR